MSSRLFCRGGLTLVFPISVVARDMALLEYDYDSEAEWEAEDEPEDGEDCVSGDENEEEDGYVGICLG